LIESKMQSLDSLCDKNKTLINKWITNEIVLLGVLLSLLIAITYGMTVINISGIPNNNKNGLSKLILLITIHHPIRYKYYS
jgi:hypothetical protein